MAKNKKHKLKGLLIFLGIVLAIVLAVVIWINVNTYTPEGQANWYGNGTEWSGTDDFDEYYEAMPTYTFTNPRGDNKLKIMQIADPQFKFGHITKDKVTYELLDLALESEKPDIVVVTGDLTMSIAARRAVINFCEYMEEKQIYWCFTYGNHDSEFTLSKYRHSQIFAKYEHCLFDGGPSNVKGESNYFVKIVDQSDNLLYVLSMIDSNMYPDNHELTDMSYDEIHQTQVDWYKWNMQHLLAKKPDLQSSMFMHIPMKKLEDLYVDGTTGFAGRVDEYVTEDSATGIFCQGENGGQAMYQAVVQMGSTKGIFFGHDHVNTFRTMSEDGILMGYGRCCGYHTYPFFDTEGENKVFEWLMTVVYGKEPSVMLYMDEWVDDNGDIIGKGTSVISIDLSTSNYGNIDMYDVSHSGLQGGNATHQNEISNH